MCIIIIILYCMYYRKVFNARGIFLQCSEHVLLLFCLKMVTKCHALSRKKATLALRTFLYRYTNCVSKPNSPTTSKNELCVFFFKCVLNRQNYRLVHHLSRVKLFINFLHSMCAKRVIRCANYCSRRSEHKNFEKITKSFYEGKQQNPSFKNGFDTIFEEYHRIQSKYIYNYVTLY